MEDGQNILDEQKQGLRREEVMNNQDLRDGQMRKKTALTLSLSPGMVFK